MSAADVFVSYRSVDLNWARWIGRALQKAGFTVVLQDWDFEGGGNFVAAMHSALTETRLTVAVLTPAYAQAPSAGGSEYVLEEWTSALHDGKLLPVRVIDVRLEGLLGAHSYVDVVGTPQATARTRLIDAVTRRLSPSGEQSDVLFPGPADTGEHEHFPGGRAPVWNLREPRNPNFTGRADELEEIDRLLADGRTVAVTALGGMGKSDLVREFAYRSAGRYDTVWWVRAEEPATLTADLAALAARLDLADPAEVGAPAAVDAALSHLSDTRGWLLVLDNAPGLDEVRPFVPQGGNVLITSRDPAFGGLAKVLRLDALPEDEAADFLVSRTGDDDRSSAETLAELLGYLPLALEQAGAYVEARGGSLAGYLELAGKRLEQLMKEPPASGYPETVLTTWELGFAAVEKQVPAAAELLTIAAFLAPEAIPESLFLEHPDLLPDLLAAAVRDQAEFEDALGELTRFSLVRRSAGAFSVHRLVQLVTRARLDEDEPAEALRGVRLVQAGFPFSQADPATWEVCARVLPHGLAVVDHADRLDANVPETSALMGSLSRYLRVRADLVRALQLAERALAVDETIFDANDPTIGADLVELGRAYKALGDPEAARPLLERALVISEDAYGPDHANTSVVLSSLGLTLKDLGDYEAARPLLERALAILTEAQGPDGADVAVALSNLAVVLMYLDDPLAARPLLESALAITETAYGPVHPSVAVRLVNLAGTLNKLGEIDAALPLMQRAVAIDEATYGSDHPEVAMDLLSVADVHESAGQVDAARQCLERAAAIYEGAYGNGHPMTMLALERLESLR